jgi:hypothetical protein
VKNLEGSALASPDNSEDLRRAFPRISSAGLMPCAAPARAAQWPPSKGTADAKILDSVSIYNLFSIT